SSRGGGVLVRGAAASMADRCRLAYRRRGGSLPAPRAKVSIGFAAGAPPFRTRGPGGEAEAPSVVARLRALGAPPLGLPAPRPRSLRAGRSAPSRRRRRGS